MKKRIAMFVLAAMTASLVMTGCGKDKEKESGSKKQTFTVGFDAEFEPYGYKDADGEYVGFDLDLAEEVCKRNGWELKKQPIDWDAKNMELDSGNIDCIWNGFTMNGREDEYTWSKPYVDNSQVIVVAKDSGIVHFDDLAGKDVLVQADSSALAALTDPESAKDLGDSFGHLTQVPDYNTAFMNLEAGAADAVAMDVGVAEGKVAKSDGKFVILEDIVAKEQYAIGFKLGNEELRDKVQATLDEMAEDGTLMKIAEKYAAYNMPASLCLGK